MTYTLKRLVKGLASSRKAARQGFAMALTEIILIFDTISVEDIITYMKDSLTVTKAAKSQVSIIKRVKSKDSNENN